MLAQFTEKIIDYWVSKGFDSDELVALGPVKSIEFLISVAFSCPKLNNSMFGLHIRAFMSSLGKAAQLKPNSKQPLARLSRVTLK